MARLRPQDGLHQLLEAGLRVFARQGLHKARMADVAEEMGVSAGTLYGYVESKEALFFLLVDRGLSNEPVALPEKLPIKAPPRDVMFARLQEQVATHFQLHRLGEALSTENVPSARAELRGILEEFYDLTERTRRFADVIERSAYDVPEIAQWFLGDMRKGVFAAFAAYVRSRVETGQFRKTIDVNTAARFLIETITMFARHRHNDPDDPLPLDDEAARRTVITLVTDALVLRGD